MDDSLLQILVCPRCHGSLRSDTDVGELVCTSDGCGLAYPVTDGIPVMLEEEARRPS